MGVRTVDGTQVFRDAYKRIQELEAEIKRMQPIVDIVALWRAGKTRTPDGKWIEGEMVQAYDDYESSRPK